MIPAAVEAEAPFRPVALGAPSVSDAEFQAFQRLIYAEAGIHLNTGKKALLAGRLSRRLRDLRLPSLEAYRRYIEKHPEERVPLLDRITTNETRFFREPAQFEFLERRLVPDWLAAAEAGLRPRRLRVWSAGCSSGEEPFSLAMVLLALCPPQHGWEVEIEATDISTKVLRRAEEAVWPQERAAHIPDRYLKRFMLRGVRSQQGKVKASPELRRLVRFERLNLMSGGHSGMGRFDLILCRNVLIYFDAASKARALKGLLERLAPGGHLFVGHSETLGRIAPTLRPVCPNVYKLEDAAAA
jgi:chemotaxis protein methyltransferase CheR